ncbi:MAG: hypothetical protein M0Q53_20725 [Prolixibacteraceae bacterium]|jgi:hypothetical protein|nr:hypothetical protein [Prolixibacteraceae bacterium]
MKAYEFIELIKGPIQTIIRNGIKIDDIVYLELYKDFITVRHELGSNKAALLHTAKKYKFSRLKVKRIVDRMGKVVIVNNKKQ